MTLGIKPPLSPEPTTDADELEALIEEARHRARRRRLGYLALIGAVVTAGGGIYLAIGGNDDAPMTDPQAPSVAVPVAEGCTAVPELRQRQVLLACEEFSGGRELQLRTERDSGGRSGCLEIYGMGGGLSRACGYVPYKRDPAPSSPITLDTINQLKESAVYEVYGSASPEVSAVKITYSDRNGQTDRIRATLLRINDEAALRAAGLERPFRYFVADVPPSAVDASATAKAADGQPMKTIDLAIASYRPPFVYGRE